ncbi:LacI family DNA-binding transcriptional regulator [Sciscionella sediminilitoris]|uniref:LacI family DNA-binding transcriptional regulator n=1 Tax=Sciscionella sediminilitoris TaxID=1445613 RepID=UPI0004DF64FC|nr:LacI family DNA-binding transcriptional regulator [Sciscionella sp. SE31]
MSSRAVTIRDVAERAQVSISTVSHTFSGSRPISAPTRERVLAAARELGYDANPSARSLRTGRSGLVGLFLRPRYAVAGTPDRAETFNRLVGSVATEMLRRKTGLIHVPDLHDPAVASVPMDGCLVAHPYGSDEVLAEVQRRGIPTVTVEEDPDRPELSWAVRLDYPRVVTELLEHLREQGAREIALLSGTEDNAWNRRPRQTYLDWCARIGMRSRTGLLSEGLSGEETTARARELLTAADRPDAFVVCTCDGAAVFTKVAAELGIEVPGELLLAALTDSEHGRVATPRITAMDLNHEVLAEQAVELMFARLSGAAEPEEPVTVDPVLRLRESTARR